MSAPDLPVPSAGGLELVRLLLAYAHLLLMVFALHRVLATDVRLLRGLVTARELLATHRQVLLLFAGLWATGSALAAIGTGFDAQVLLDRPKLLTKLAVAGVLTVNAVVLRGWCFPRLTAAREPTCAARAGIAMAGAVSTASWLGAAFIGIVRPQPDWTLGPSLALAGALLLAAALLALGLAVSGLLVPRLAASGPPPAAPAGRLPSRAAPRHAVESIDGGCDLVAGPRPRW